MARKVLKVVWSAERSAKAAAGESARQRAAARTVDEKVERRNWLYNLTHELAGANKKQKSCRVGTAHQFPRKSTRKIKTAKKKGRSIWDRPLLHSLTSLEPWAAKVRLCGDGGR